MASVSPVAVAIATAGHPRACAPPAPMPLSSTALNSAAASNGAPTASVSAAAANADGDGDDAAAVQRTLNDLRTMGNRLRVASQRHQDMIRATQQRWAEMGKCPPDTLLRHPSPHEMPGPQALLQTNPSAIRTSPLTHGTDGTRGMLPDQPEERPEQSQQDTDMDMGESILSQPHPNQATPASGLLHGLPQSPPSLSGLALHSRPGEG